MSGILRRFRGQLRTMNDDQSGRDTIASRDEARGSAAQRWADDRILILGACRVSLFGKGDIEAQIHRKTSNMLSG